MYCRPVAAALSPQQRYTFFAVVVVDLGVCANYSVLCAGTWGLLRLNSAPTPPTTGSSVQTPAFSVCVYRDGRKTSAAPVKTWTESVGCIVTRPSLAPASPPTATPFWPDSWSSGVPAAQRHQAHSKKSAQLRADEGQLSLFKNKARSDTTSL